MVQNNNDGKSAGPDSDGAEMMNIVRGFLMGCIVSVAALSAGCDKDNSVNKNNQSEVFQEKPATTRTAKAEYVGKKECISCHQAETEAWKGSHHDLAMQPATIKTVLGDFDNTSFNYYGTESRFYKKGDKYFVTTDGPDGKLTEYPIAYTFGVYPLQQYLIEFPGGRLQALNVVWDSRKQSEGGQRWYHLYPNENIKSDDELHWTGINQNWNYMCANCHSTNLHKNYNPDTNIYRTTWTDIDVSCEACHGPASRHVEWAGNLGRGKKSDIANKGFSIAFNERRDVTWTIDPQTGNARRSQPKQGNKEIDTCAVCHSRRVTAYPGYQPGDRLTDYFDVSLLREPLYHVDGQINDEVYVYGSFLQSKMYGAGVTCSDCHQPHSLKLREKGNKLCAQCHLPGKYNTPSHHLHVQNSVGSSCVNCHMPIKKYMVIDGRRDHSFRIPRPDLSVTLGVPNACNKCHTDKSGEWAAKVLQQHFGKPKSDRYAVYAKATAAGRQGSLKAEELLLNLIMDNSQSEIARASAVTLLPGYLTSQSAPVLQAIAQSEEPLLGLALASVVDEIPARYRPAFAVPLLYDNSRVTRSLAAHSLVGVSLDQFPPDVIDKYHSAINEYLTSNRFNAERPEALTNLGDYYLKSHQIQKAKSNYEKAIDMAGYYTPAYVNLSNLYRLQGDEAAAQKVLSTALTRVREKADIYYSLGLSYVRSKKMDEAIKYLRLAYEDPASTAHYHYVYAIALNSIGDSKQALNVLEQSLSQYGYNQEILSALVSINHELGNEAQSNYYKRQLGRE